MAREYPLDRYRNFGIMAHIDAGKTTTTERILTTLARNTKSAKCMTALRPWTGWSRSKSAASPSRPPRRRRSGSAPRTVETAQSPKFRFNIIDTPGHVDFTIEVERSLAVLDGAVCVLDANAGVEPQTETVWRQADRYKVPRIVYVNKMDKIGADFFNCVEDDRRSHGRESRFRSSARSALRANSKALSTSSRWKSGSGRARPRRDLGAPADPRRAER